MKEDRWNNGRTDAYYFPIELLDSPPDFPVLYPLPPDSLDLHSAGGQRRFGRIALVAACA